MPEISKPDEGAVACVCGDLAVEHRSECLECNICTCKLYLDSRDDSADAQ